MEKEIWKDIPGYEGLYQVSNLGNVLSLNYGRTGKVKTMGYFLNHKGYLRVRLTKDKVCKSISIHRLIANTFIENTYNKPQVNHKNGVKTDNRVENLEWMTASENSKHSHDLGLQKTTDNNFLRKHHPFKGKFGIDNPKSKIVDQFDKNGIFIKKWYSIADICRYYDILPSSISQCLSGKNKTCNGYIFKLGN